MRGLGEAQFCDRRSIWISVTFVVGALLTLFFALNVKPFEPVGPELLHNPGLGEGLEGWRSYGPSGAVEVDGVGGVRLRLDDPAKSVGLTQTRRDLGGYARLILSGELACENVVPGKRGWEKARLILSSHDDQGKWLPAPHVVANLTGTRDWRQYSEVFKPVAQAREWRISLQLPRASGTLSARALSLHEAAENPVFSRGRLVAFCFWPMFLAVLLLPRIRGRASRLLKACALLTLLIILWGTLMPAETKTEIFSESRKVFKQLQEKSTESLKTASDKSDKSDSPLEASVDQAKLGHFLLFALLAFLLALVSAAQSGVFLIVELFQTAAVTEMLQFFVEKRTPLISDLGIDMAGVLLGLFLIWIIRKLAPVAQKDEPDG